MSYTPPLPCAERWCDVVPGQTYTITVGAIGGGASTSSADRGGHGGASAFGSGAYKTVSLGASRLVIGGSAEPAE